MKKLRKFTAFLTSAVVCAGMLSALPSSAAAWVKLTDQIEWRLENGTLYVRGTGAMPNYTAGGSHSANPGERTFEPTDADKLPTWYLFHDQIERIVIWDGITRISELTFIGCTNAVSVSIPASVEEISKSAFAYCYSMQEVKFAEDSQLKYIEEYAFSYNTDLLEIDLPETVRELDGTALSGTGLTTLHIPKDLVRIDGNVLENTPSFTEFTIDPENTAFTLKDGVLYDKDMFILYRFPPNRQQETFVIPDSVETVIGGAFAYTQHLKTVYYPNNVHNVGVNQFLESESVEIVRLPQTMQWPPSQCFAYCMSLRTLILPSYIRNAGGISLRTEQLDIYYPRTQAELEQIGNYSQLKASEYTIHCNTTEDDLISADISGDGVVDSQDASHLLNYASKRGTYFNGGLMLYQHYFADGMVFAAEQQGDAAVPATLVTGTSADATDAAMLLQYSSAVGTGYDEGLTTFLNRQYE